MPDSTPSTGLRMWRALDDEADAVRSARGGLTVSRRGFLQTMSGGLAALSAACTQTPADHILPFARQVAGRPGASIRYATTMEIDGLGFGVLGVSRDGRPIKIEGNPRHPASLGATHAFAEASLLGLYDPDRAREMRIGARPANWSDIQAAFGLHAGAAAAPVHVLLPPTASPLVHAWIARLKERRPGSRVFAYAPLASNAAASAARALFGRPAVPQYDLTKPQVVLALGADLFGEPTTGVRRARDFAARRRADDPGAMSRLYCIETGLSITGAQADHRLAVRPETIARLAARLLARVSSIAGGGALPAPAGSLEPRIDRWLDAAAADLAAHRGAAVVVAGALESPDTHALAYALNERLDAAGAGAAYIAPVVPAVDGDLPALAEAIHDRDVHTLVVLAGNPAYAAPASLDVGSLLRHVERTLYCGPYENETAAACQVVVPGAHFLETWADARAFDGTASLVQPLIRPLYGGRTIAEMLAALCGDPAPDARTLLRQQWVPEADADADTRWHDWLSAGVIDGTAAEPIQVAVDASALAAVLSRVARITANGGFSIAFRGDASVHDGSFTNNPWLQELPDPISKLTWGNAASISPATAERLHVRDGQEIELRLAGRTLRLPVMRVPGHADDAATVPFGYGRAGAESIARGLGANAYRLWPSIEAYSAAGAVISPAFDASGHARFAPLTTTQRHWELEGRPIVLHHTSTAFAADPGFTREARVPVPTLYDYGREDGPQWGMSIDLSVCTGCSACVVACQAENNIPIVGRDEVAKGREMHWLRIDRYFAGPADRPRVFMQPMLCQQCEHAPCEYVCPVNATVHSPDGLNEMVYNRCVGTRFCSNNCPYKVRRFNWFNYTAQTPEVQTLVFNPEVTVRDRGVMEKCTFCVQRIRAAEIDVTVNGGAIPPDGVRTACQQACPTQAIVFGARNVRGWSLQQSLQSERRYDVLHELGTRPRVTYLARITNPNPALGEDA